MNQQLIFNNDFYYEPQKAAIVFSCLVGGLKVTCLIKVPAQVEPLHYLAQVKEDAFTWEDKAEYLLLQDAYVDMSEVWL